jgi:hypothetical protein
MTGPVGLRRVQYPLPTAALSLGPTYPAGGNDSADPRPPMWQRRWPTAVVELLRRGKVSRWLSVAGPPPLPTSPKTGRQQRRWPTAATDLTQDGQATASLAHRGRGARPRPAVSGPDGSAGLPTVALLAPDRCSAGPRPLLCWPPTVALLAPDRCSAGPRPLLGWPPTVAGLAPDRCWAGRVLCAESAWQQDPPGRPAVRRGMGRASRVVRCRLGRGRLGRRGCGCR